MSLQSAPQPSPSGAVPDEMPLSVRWGEGIGNGSLQVPLVTSHVVDCSCRDLSWRVASSDEFEKLMLTRLFVILGLPLHAEAQVEVREHPEWVFGKID